jgi:hypothetical protein
MIVLDIHESTPSLNVSQNLHWVKRHQLRHKWGWLIRAARLEARVYPKEPLRKARLTFERWGPKLLDHDNHVGGCKPVVDSLVREGLILDDKPECIGQPQYLQHIGPRRTAIRIEGLL